MRKTVRYAVAQGLAAGLALALSACGGDPEPRFEAEPSPTPSEVTSSAPVKEAWEEKSDDGAVAFVEHWIDEFNAMRATGDAEPLRALSDRSCESCTASIAYTEEIYSSGGELVTDGWELLQASAPADANSLNPVLGLRVRRSPQVLRESAEAQPQRFKGGDADYTAYLEWKSGGWIMTRLDLA